MRILTEQEIESIFDYNNDNAFEKYLSFYNLLEKHGDNLHKKYGVLLSDILYSKYYWFLKLKKEHETIRGKDAGFDQQAFELMVNIYEYCGLEIDIDNFEVIERMVYSC